MKEGVNRSASASIACAQLFLHRGGRSVLENISATFRPGELTAVIGPNGAGKSSLLASLVGVLKATAGRVTIGERDTQDIPARERARQCVYLPQAEAPAWSMTAEDLVALGLLPWGRIANKLGRIHSALEKVDALGFARRPVTELSGGELRRVQLARLLVGDAPVLIADEPGAALDIGHQLQLMQTFRRQADDGKTVILALHDLGLAARYCDRILLLESGRLRAQGSPEEVMTPAMIGEVYGVSSRFRWREGRPEFVTGDLL